MMSGDEFYDDDVTSGICLHDGSLLCCIALCRQFE